MTDANMLLEMKSINKSFSGVPVLKQVNFSVREGEVHALIGENGAGKSTLIKILSGAYTRDSGDILLRGKEVHVSHPLDAQRLGISVIYQEFSLVPQLNGAENIFLGRWPEKPKGWVDWGKLVDEAAHILRQMNVSIDMTVPVRTLSVAHRQMIEIARALSFHAKIIVMDEPTSSLTDKEIDTLFQLIRELKRQGVTIIYISHRLDESFGIADRVTVMKDGMITGVSDVSGVIKSTLIRLMVGRDIQDLYPRRTSKVGELILEVKHLTRKGVVQDVSFSIRAGEILGFAGLVGAGRTETMRAIFGADRLDSGEIYVRGKMVRINSPADAIKARIALAPEDRRSQGLVTCLTVAENITLANMSSVSRGYGVISRKLDREKAEQYIHDLDIRTLGPQQRVRNLSGGNQQKVVLAKLLNTKADLFIFDEPTRGIDVGSKAEIYQLMGRLAEAGAGVIMVSCELPEILGMSDRIFVMHGGRIVAEVLPNEATEEKILTYAVGGASE